jgi:hypothetical protein
MIAMPPRSPRALAPELQFSLYSAGVLAPGVNSLSDWLAWCESRGPIAAEATVLPLPLALPANERRRSSQVVRLALACAEQALAGSPFAPDQLRSVFASDEGTGEVCQQMLESLVTTGQLSPSLFHNSVHNAPAGYFSIATQNRQPTVSVSLGSESFAAGLLCAVSEACSSGQPVLLVAYDAPLPEPMRSLLPVTQATAAACVIAAAGPTPAGSPIGRFTLSLHPAGADGDGDGAPAAWLPDSWRANGSAQAFAVLALLGAGSGSCELAFGGQRMRVTLVQGSDAC